MIPWGLIAVAGALCAFAALLLALAVMASTISVLTWVWALLLFRRRR